LVRARAEAQGVLLLVIGGKHGEGFSCQADLELTLLVPDMLERIAAEIRQANNSRPRGQPS
jgi:hypothetical protein